MKHMNRLQTTTFVGVLTVAAALAGNLSAFAQTKPGSVAAKPVAKYSKCVVTGEKLGSMGKPLAVAYTGKNPAYKGKTVPVCCEGCTARVKKDPDTFFKKVYGTAPSKSAK